MKWFKCSDKFPSANDKIIVKMIGSKIDSPYLYVDVREGEGLGGWFNKWRYATKYEIKIKGKNDDKR